MQASNNIKTDRVQSSKIQNKSHTKLDSFGAGLNKNISQNQFYSPQASAQSSMRRKSGQEIQYSNSHINSKFISENSKIGSYVNTYRQFDMTDIRQNPSNFNLRNFQPTLKPIPNINSSPQKKGYGNKNTSKDDFLNSGQEFSDTGFTQQYQNKQNTTQNVNMLMKLTASPGQDNANSSHQKMYTDSVQNTNRVNTSYLGLQDSEPLQIRQHTANPSIGSSKNYFYSPAKLGGRQSISSKGEKLTHPQGVGARSVSSMQLNKRKINPNSINSLNNINDFEDTQIFQEFQKPQLSTQHNESINNQQQLTETSHMVSTLQNIPVVKKDSSIKQFTVKTKSASQLQTLSGFQKLQRVRKALALGSKVAQFLEVLKAAPQKYDHASEQYSKECIQILKGILQEKEHEAEQFEQMELDEEKDKLTGLDIQKGITKRTQKLTQKVLRTIQDSIVEPLSQKTYRALYYEKCKEIDKVKFTYKDMEKEVDVLRKNQKVFDDIAANYFRKTEVIEKEKDKLNEEKKAALLEVERLEKKLDESNSYYNFWQGEYHLVNRKYNEEVYALGQQEEKVKKERTEKIFLENQLSSLQKQIESKNGELEKIKTAQVQLKWMKGSISTYQQDLLNKNIQINLCRDLVISKADALQLVPKSDLEKEQPLIDLVKQVFQAIAVKLN